MMMFYCCVVKLRRLNCWMDDLAQLGVASDLNMVLCSYDRFLIMNLIY